MSEKLKELLNKINEEGLQKAEENANAIELMAKKDADKILRDAKSEAKRIVEDAKNKAAKTEKTTELALKQASRDLILSLKDEVRKVFHKIVSGETRKAMSSENMADILKDLIETYLKENGKASDIKVLLKKEDLERLKKSFIAKLKDRIKDGVEFRPSPNINSGFSISFDKGKSFFDFTDEGLKEALCAYLNPEVTRLLK